MHLYRAVHQITAILCATQSTSHVRMQLQARINGNQGNFIFSKNQLYSCATADS